MFVTQSIVPVAVTNNPSVLLSTNKPLVSSLFVIVPDSVTYNPIVKFCPLRWFSLRPLFLAPLPTILN